MSWSWKRDTTGSGLGRRVWVPDPLPTYSPPVYNQPVPIAPPPTPPAQIAGVEPQALEAILYGKDIPLFVGGKMALGGRIIEGPFYSGTQDDPYASYIASHAMCANPGGTRTITQFNLRGKSAWNSTDGYLDPTVLPSGSLSLRYGYEDQLPFQSSINRYGGKANAYRSHLLSEVVNLPLRAFGGIVPFPTIYVEDSSFGDPDEGITRNDAVEVLLRYARFDDTEFEVSVLGRDQAWIVGRSYGGAIQLFQDLRRIFVNWNITFDDKIYITEPTEFSAAGQVTRTNHVTDSIVFTIGDPLTLPREKLYSFIDPDRDFEPNVASARLELYPIPTTQSVNSESIELPIVANASEAMADVNFALFQQHAMNASQVQAELLVDLFGMEPGDGIQFADHAVINYAGRVTETIHSFVDWTVDVSNTLHCGGR